MAGFTTVRDLGGSGVNVSLRNAINAGKVDGPRIYTAEKPSVLQAAMQIPQMDTAKNLWVIPAQRKGS